MFGAVGQHNLNGMMVSKETAQGAKLMASILIKVESILIAKKIKEVQTQEC